MIMLEMLCYIMPGGIRKQCVIHRCILSSSNLFSLLYGLIQSAENLRFPMFKQQANMGKLTLYLLITLGRLSFSMSLRLMFPVSSQLLSSSVVLLISN